MPPTNLFRRLKTSWRKGGGLGNDKHTEEKAEELFPTAGAYGLRVVAEGENIVADIVFVHGLTGNRETTWTYRERIFWPKELLANDLKNVRIFTFGYDADVVGLLNIAGGNTLRDHGKSLAQDLALRRAKTETSSRPVIFVAHSLGGLVVEQTLLIARGTSELHIKSLLSSTTAIAFMGTPHLGSHKADWARSLTQLSSLLRRTNREVVAVLEPGSEMLANLQQEFHTMLEDRRKNEDKWIDMFCFYEELPYGGIGYIVERQSAILSGYSSASIHQNHSDMTKFTGAEDAGYERVSGQLWLWVNAIQKAMTPSANDQGTLAPQAGNRAQLVTYAPRVSTELEEDSGGRQQVRRIGSSRGNSATLSGGGSVFMGSVSAGRDFRYNQH